MKLPATKVIVFNAAAVLVTAAAVGAVVRSWVFTPTAAPCSERYLNTTSLALERGGAVLTAADLQAGLGGNDAGVLENVAVARLDPSAPAPVAMTVSLPAGAMGPNPASGAKAGISFPWRPRLVRGKAAACLVYSVLLPADFAFARGGTLPGLAGADAAEPAPDGFVARIVWRDGARGGIINRVTSSGETRMAPAEREAFAFPRGRWVRLEQEVVLNTPKQADGALRLWVDGRLAVDRTDQMFRARPDVTLAGVAADVFYGFEPGAAAAPKDTRISLTPFELRWR
jgi:hypothetical protein